jgi:hypothetical protein
MSHKQFEQLMEQYLTLLDTHDWYFEYSDDFRVYQEGRKQLDELRQMSTVCDPELTIYNSHKPKGLNNGT